MRPFMLFLTILLSVLPSCSNKESLTPEELIERSINDAVDAARRRDIGAFKAFLTEDFQSDQGDDRQRALATLQYYFMKHKRLYILHQIESIELTSPTSADVVLIAAIAGRNAFSLKELPTISAETYRFTLAMRTKDKEHWRVQRAGWSHADVEDFLDE